MMGVRFAILFLCGVITHCLGVSSVAAEQSESDGSIVDRLDATSVDRYRDRLPHELYVQVKRDKASFVVGKTPVPKASYTSTKVAPSAKYTLSEEGVFSAPEKVSFSQAVFASATLDRGSLQARGYQILWNASSALWHHPRISVESSVYMHQAGDDEPNRLVVRLARIHPALYPDTPGTLTPIFREKIQLLKPQALSTLSWLTLRFFGSDEDYVWVSSPAIKKIRQLTGSNRDDPMFAAMLAPNDFLVWSGKVEGVKPLAVETVKVLVPVYEEEVKKGSDDASCRIYDFANGFSRYNHSKNWFPDSVKFYEREAWRIELESLDPYSNDSQQVLYVDKESNLPVYGASYSISGEFRRFRMGVLGAVGNDKDREPLIVGQIVTSTQGWRISVNTEHVSLCGAEDGKTVLVDFDPASFISFKS